MAAVLTGTPLVVTWAAGANPAGQSITIPTDATAVYMFWTYFSGVGGLSSVTLNSNNPDETHELEGTGSLNATGVTAWYNPATGSQTLDPAWDLSPSTGAVCTVYYVKDGDTTGWRDVDSDANTGSTAVSVTLTTETDDLVIKFDAKDTTSVPGNTAGWTSDTTDDNGGMAARAAHISATGSTQVCPSENENFSSVVAISIGAGAAGLTFLPYHADGQKRRNPLLRR
jgi:hypothetical protein